jgi:hypothetical protein
MNSPTLEGFEEEREQKDKDKDNDGFDETHM